MTPAKKRIDLETLTPEQRSRVERALHPRNTPITTRHRADDVERWKREAKAAKLSFVDWVEHKLNAKGS